MAIGVSLLLLGAGCSGINQTHSVSPATFFLPGLLHNTTPEPNHTVPLEETQAHTAQS
jgi:hypothetical protein